MPVVSKLLKPSDFAQGLRRTRALNQNLPFVDRHQVVGDCNRKWMRDRRRVRISAKFRTHPLGQFSLPIKDTDDIQQDVREDPTILDHGIRMVSLNWQAGFLACGSFY